MCSIIGLSVNCDNSIDKMDSFICDSSGPLLIVGVFQRVALAVENCFLWVSEKESRIQFPLYTRR